MMKITDAMSLGEIVNRVPSASRMLTSMGLDFCCGGSKSLRDASREVGLDPDVVIAQINDMQPEPIADWVSMTPAQLVDHIESTHHQYLHNELEYLDTLAQKVLSVHGERHPELQLVATGVQALRKDLEPHLMKEERILFPMIRRVVNSETPQSDELLAVKAPISVMMADHEVAGELLEKLRSESRGFKIPEDACASYKALYEGLERLESDTHMHVHKENNILFPEVLKRAAG